MRLETKQTAINDLLLPRVLKLLLGTGVRVHESFENLGLVFTGHAGRKIGIHGQQIAEWFKADDYTAIDNAVKVAIECVSTEMGQLYALLDEAKVASPGGKA